MKKYQVTVGYKCIFKSFIHTLGVSSLYRWFMFHSCFREKKMLWAGMFSILYT